MKTGRIRKNQKLLQRLQFKKPVGGLHLYLLRLYCRSTELRQFVTNFNIIPDIFRIEIYWRSSQGQSMYQPGIN